MLLQLDRLDCTECDTSLDLVSIDGFEFPKGTVYIRSLRIPLENTPLRYHSFFCNKCENVIKCVAVIDEQGVSK